MNNLDPGTRRNIEHSAFPGKLANGIVSAGFLGFAVLCGIFIAIWLLSQADRLLRIIEKFLGY